MFSMKNLYRHVSLLFCFKFQIPLKIKVHAMFIWSDKDSCKTLLHVVNLPFFSALNECTTHRDEMSWKPVIFAMLLGVALIAHFENSKNMITAQFFLGFFQKKFPQNLIILLIIWWPTLYHAKIMLTFLLTYLNAMTVYGITQFLHNIAFVERTLFQACYITLSNSG